MLNQSSVPFEDILLTPREKWILFSLRFYKSRKGDVFSLQLWKLKEYDLISQNYKTLGIKKDALFRMEHTLLPTGLFDSEFTGINNSSIVT